MSFGQRLAAGEPGRLVLGVLAAALVGCFTPAPLLLLLTTFGALSLGIEPMPMVMDWIKIPAAMVVFLPAAFLLTLAVGLPLHVLLAILNHQSRLAYSVGGATMIGLLCLALFGPRYLWLLAGLVGGLSGLAFRSVWRP